MQAGEFVTFVTEGHNLLSFFPVLTTIINQ